MKRYLIEFGTGADLHGGDCQKAAQRALRDAISHCCMAGTLEIFGLTDVQKQMRLKIKVAVPWPEKVDADQLLTEAGYTRENAEIEIVNGGITEKGVHIDRLGPGDDIVVAIAFITVYVDA